MGLQINSEVSYGFFLFVTLLGAISGIFVLLGAASAVEKKSPPILEKYGPLYQ